jgi:hypothetical protein
LGTFISKFYGRSTPFSAELVALRRIIWCGLSSLFWETTLSSEMEFSWVKCLYMLYFHFEWEYFHCTSRCQIS